MNMRTAKAVRPSHDEEAAIAVMAHAFSLGTALGVSDRKLAKAAMAIAVEIATQQNDPDGFLATISGMTRKVK